MLRRILGIVLIILAVSGVWLVFTAGQSAKQTTGSLGEGLKTNIDLVLESLDAISDSLLHTQDVLADVEAALVRAEETAVAVSTSLEGIDPILIELQTITTQDLPDSLEAIQQAVPDAVQAADAIDATLTTLNRFEIDTTILGFPIRYDLGINYNPTVPFSASVQEIGVSLEGIPERLRSLEDAFADTQSNTELIGADMSNLGGDLAAINEQIAEFSPLIDDLNGVVIEAGDNLRLVQGQIDDQVASVQNTLTIGMIWLIFSQMVPLYLGYELILGRLAPQKEPDEIS